MPEAGVSLSPLVSLSLAPGSSVSLTASLKGEEEKKDLHHFYFPFWLWIGADLGAI